MEKPKKSFTGRVRGRMTGYIGAALGLIAGLAWNDAIKSLIESIYPQSGGIAAKFIYAVAITLFVAVLFYFLRQDEE